jgi:hypothetical protein
LGSYLDVCPPQSKHPLCWRQPIHIFMHEWLSSTYNKLFNNDLMSHGLNVFHSKPSL